MDSQDIRKMGSLNLFLPFTYLVFLFGSLSLMAFPFTSGWYSKDLIIELLIVPNNFTHTIAYIFTLLGAFLTSSYSVRVKKMVMLNRPNFPKTMLNYVVDSNYLMTLPLLLISIGAVTFGYLSHELFLAYGSTFYLNAIFIHPVALSSTLDAQFGGSLLALVPILFLFLATT
jgi:NADH-ubiquinone oxidoreductase chain 5